MALLSIFRGTQAECSARPVLDGTLLFATDTKNIYLDKDSNRVEMSSLQDLSDYITSTQLSSAIGAEASARQKQDQLLEQAIDDKLGADDIIAGSNVQISHDEESGHITISATDTKDTNTTYMLTKSGSTITLKGSDGSETSITDADTNTTYSIFQGATTSAAGGTGLVPAPATGAADRYLCSDGTWSVPSGNDTTYSLSKNGSTITLTGSDGSTTSVTDSNTTYSLSSFGVNASAAELNYVKGVTNSIQTQLNSKAASSHTHDASNITSGTLPVTRGGTGATTAAAAFKNLSGYTLELGTNNTKDTWVPVMNGSTLQHRVIPTLPLPVSSGGTGQTGPAKLYAANGWYVYVVGSMVWVYVHDIRTGSGSWDSTTCPYVMPSSYRPSSGVIVPLCTPNGGSTTGQLSVWNDGKIIVMNAGANGTTEARQGLLCYPIGF